MTRPKSRPSSLRLQSHNYTEAGAYFVTVVMYGREAILGDVCDGRVKLSRYGSLVSNVWKDLPNRYNHVALDEFIIMPDHIHGIIWLHDQSNIPIPNYTVGFHLENPLSLNLRTMPQDFRGGKGSLLTSNAKSADAPLHDTNKPAPSNQQKTLHVGVARVGYKSTANQIVNGLDGQSVNEPAPTKMMGELTESVHGLSEIIRNFKTVSAKRINLLRKLPNTPVWQRGFHDRIIRDDEELNAIRAYIQTNPLRWSLDRENQPL